MRRLFRRSVRKTFRILKGSCKPKKMGKMALWALKADVELMVLSADTGNATVVLSTADF
jgi:hypothetical protein